MRDWGRGQEGGERWVVIIKALLSNSVLCLPSASQGKVAFITFMRVSLSLVLIKNNTGISLEGF